jgi:hypothetical protein
MTQLPRHNILEQVFGLSKKGNPALAPAPAAARYARPNTPTASIR